jgi:alkanesulfonate monooxygenase SsuD/methylene tetrahydromethanopterin reductase-like flavin-dependent oxidoreductase (luciferase family)
VTVPRGVPVKLGITLPSFVDDPAIPLGVARAAEDAGVDGVFVYDHLFREGRETRRPAIESVALLGAVAAATSRIAVGTLVFRAWLRPAETLAVSIETVARIAGDRVVAAIGSGDSQSREENESFGLGFRTVAERVGALEAAVRAARGRGARVWVGGHHPSVREVAARHADGWNGWGGDPQAFAVEATETRRMADAADFECTWGGLMVLDEDEELAAEKALRLQASPGTVVGGPEGVARQLRAYANAGASWVIVGPVDSQDQENATRLGEQVKPRLIGT